MIARRAVIEALAAEPHQDAEAVAARVSRDQPGVHRATIYRTLQSLVELGVLAHTHDQHRRHFSRFASRRMLTEAYRASTTSDVAEAAGRDPLPGPHSGPRIATEPLYALYMDPLRRARHDPRVSGRPATIQRTPSLPRPLCRRRRPTDSPSRPYETTCAVVARSRHLHRDALEHIRAL